MSLGSKSTECSDLLRQFFNVQKKRIIENSRRVHISKELEQHQLFKYEKKSVISRIINKIENGEDLNIYLSDKQNELDHSDLTLSIMGLHHFHLGEIIQKGGTRKGLVKGTKSLLFIKIEEQDAYLIDILSHDITSGFLNRQLLHIIYKNWPQLLEPFRINRGGIEYTEITEEDFTKLIQLQINIPYSPEYGIAYFFPGGLSKKNTDSDIENDIFRLLDALEKTECFLKNKTRDIAEYIRQVTGIRYNVLRFSTELRDGGIVIINSNSGLLFVWDNLFLIPYKA